MSDEEKNGDHHLHHQQQQQYGTFGSASGGGPPGAYPPPPPQHHPPAIGFPQPVPPPGAAGAYYAYGYQAAPVMQEEFEMSMMGELSFFLGLQIKQGSKGTFINQAKYTKDLLKLFELDSSKSMRTPMATTTKLDNDEDGTSVDIRKYRGYAAVVEGRPIREPGSRPRLPCCGIGLGWFLFIIGFFFAAIPWYFGAFILLCVRRFDHREKPGYVACTIAAVLAAIAILIGVTNGDDDWW
ncbi:60S ribosomal protein L18a-like protein [Iris pallida]|uniref:60S ribosomal protein L18a-like protein n=1 Tax=Iris pallida TaxID=29817 RepID=A0AAX6G861_IRIPA|nr:60S ribosomal protein L18a-like protein [Iris pallida]